jgi:hypothetical protein
MTTVVFVLYGTTMTEYAQMMVDSCKWHGYRVIQLSDEKAPEIKGSDQVIRAPFDKHREELWRYQRLAEVSPPYISLDIDLIVVKDISDGFDPAYDAVLTERPANGMPFNSGVFWVQTPEFIPECIRRIQEMEAGRQAWIGGQIAMKEIREAGQLRIKSLPCTEWNDSKHIKPGGYNGSSRVLHFKGDRKQHMKAVFGERRPK